MNEMPYKLPIEDTIKTAWNKVYGSKGTIWIAVIIMVAIMLGIGIVIGILSMLMPKAEDGFDLLAKILSYLFSVGLLYVGITRAKDLPISYDMLFRTFTNNIWIKVIGVYIVQFLICIIPAIFIIGGLVLFPIMSTAMGGPLVPAIISALVFRIGLLAIIILLRLALAIDLCENLSSRCRKLPLYA